MIALQKIRLQYGERYLYKDISATIGTSDRIGLVGSNGAGKSTLLKVLCGLEEIDGGKVDKANYVTFGYLPQDGIEMHGRTLFKETELAFADVLGLKAKVEEAEERLDEMDTSSEEFYETLELIGEWEHRLEDLDAGKLPSRIESVLLGLGFSSSDMHRKTEEFSGGWQMRIALAKLLLANPSLLLLDEPTNHLDVTSQKWLEDFLLRYEGSLLMISHDRGFLDIICNRTFELSMGSLHVYSGNYSVFETQSAERKELQMKAYKSQQKEIQQAEQFINRFRAKASKAKQAQSRIKALDKIERIQIEKEEDGVSFSFAPPPRSGQTVINLVDVSKSYGDLLVIRDANLRIERGDRIVVVGVNGAGKTTIAKVIAGVEPFQSGEREIGQSTHISYFGQHQADELDKSLTVLATLEESAEGKNTTNIRSILGTFLFRGDDVFKKVSVLSGGERNRLALAKMLARSANFLILDEPTNHLDMRSQDALQNALKNYTGAYLIVSHNRAFVDPLATKVLEIRKDGLSLFPGNVSDYLRHLEVVEAVAS
ncbi:ABC-F family ATP-binding cassette domain-containing protein [Candidatus Pelagisphaera phototrophica]|uniref:ABC-F family ATP-binding cassette domain-containing protein n=1 Tax=Candidatus Pelagisphaera phototrophica TaxID=2684113 RepID=UPI0019E89DAB|nr:ABC-F family ATP-binding cassette domain-containing protein [Candidatus Pelagisphaera phototrophica]QXD33094.1 ATP-binding cassette domain-containing protein [Candidatus Pelagisphaera phototrophica]